MRCFRTSRCSRKSRCAWLESLRISGLCNRHLDTQKARPRAPCLALQQLELYFHLGAANGGSHGRCQASSLACRSERCTSGWSSFSPYSISRGSVFFPDAFVWEDGAILFLFARFLSTSR